MRVTAPIEWIRPSDSLPEQEIVVLACWVGEVELVMTVFLEGDKWIAAMPIEVDEDLRVIPPTYWAYIAIPDAIKIAAAN